MGRYDLSLEQIEQLIGPPRWRALQVWHFFYRGLSAQKSATPLPAPVRRRLESDPLFSFDLTPVETALSPQGSSLKVVFQLNQGEVVEAVLMRAEDGRLTGCVSSQAGCAMGCRFCATGQMGFMRNLTAGEIVEQVVHLLRLGLSRFGVRLSNLVFMGMGEPLANYRSLSKALCSIRENLGIGHNRITVSTVGIAPVIRSLASDFPSVRLALSLHSLNQERRERLIPIAARYPLKELEEALTFYLVHSRQRLSVEWTLISEFNDSLDEARELAAFAKRFRAHVNLIPLNETPHFEGRAPSRSRVLKFQNALRQAGIAVTVRNTLGSEIEAACGQLGAAIARRQAVSASWA